MAIRQKTSPNLSVQAVRGWCLKFVDDAVNAPSRKPTAQAAYNTEKANGNIRTSDLPIGLWVPIFFSLTKGQYAGLGHVAWAFNHGNGWVEIHDSETRPGARPVYTSIAQVLAWFGAHGIQYLGWSYWVDGVQVVEDYTPAPAAPNGESSGNKKGVATVIVDALHVRNEPSTDSAIIATYGKGQTFNYDSWVVKNGYVWLSYMSFSGVRRYVAEGPNDGNDNNVWVSGGV
jgi:hypothetical protein